MDIDGQATVVVGVDGSAGSRAALQYALEDAARPGGAVRIVSVFPPVEHWAGAWGVSAQRVTAEIEADLREQTRKAIDAVVAKGAALAAVPVEVEAVPGSAAHVLVERSQAADLLVVGHRGRGEVASMLLGSVGLQCVLHARCPVTVVPQAAAERAAERSEGALRRAAVPAAAPAY